MAMMDGCEEAVRKIARLQARLNLHSFVRRSMEIVLPEVKFCPNWHLEMVCDALQMCADGKIKRLIISLPPRNLKSICISVAFPAWLLGMRPNERIIVSSYSQLLSSKHSMDCRAIMKSNWYEQLFPNSKVAFGSDTKTRFSTTSRGCYFATSIGGTLLGKGGNVLIVDDPQTPIGVTSKAKRKQVIDWFQTSLMSRLDDKEKGVIIIVMQRLHPDDLVGHLMEKEPNLWEKIVLPAVGPEEEEVRFGGKVYHYRKKGEPLNAHRDTVESLEAIAQSMGSYAFQAQYQQNPMAEEGGLVKKEWLRYYDQNELQNCASYYISVDCAKGKGDANDYTVMSVIGRDAKQNNLLVEVDRGRYSYPELRKKMCEKIAKYKPTATLIEDTSNGSSLIQELGFNGYRGIIPIRPHKNKVIRFNHALVGIESGRFFVPKSAPFLPDFLNEMLSFPLSKNDDQVDTISQYFGWIYERDSAAGVVPKIRNL